MIILNNVTKIFNTHGVHHYGLKDVSYHFERGYNYGILGQNGAGKSTLLKVISGELRPDSGTVIRNARLSWPIGFTGGFHGSLTGRENLRFISRIYAADIRKVTKFVEEFAELGQYLDAPLKTYSSGMRAKLAFGLSMAIDFECYLIDEITAVGDVSFRRKSEAYFESKRQTANLLMVSHNPGTIRKFCTRGLVLYHHTLLDFPDIEEAISFYENNF